MLNLKKYRCLKKNSYRSNNLILKNIEITHIEKIRKWRNRQISILRQNYKISKIQQVEYFNQNVWPEKNNLYPDKILFSIFYKNHLIGYGGLVHISWQDKRSEISFLLDNKYKESSLEYKFFFETFLKLIINISKELKLFKIYTECFSSRTDLIKLLFNFGFEDYQINRNHYLKNKTFITSIIQTYYINNNTNKSK